MHKERELKCEHDATGHDDWLSGLFVVRNLLAVCSSEVRRSSESKRAHLFFVLSFYRCTGRVGTLMVMNADDTAVVALGWDVAVSLSELTRIVAQAGLRKHERAAELLDALAYVACSWKAIWLVLKPGKVSGLQPPAPPRRTACAPHLAPCRTVPSHVAPSTGGNAPTLASPLPNFRRSQSLGRAHRPSLACRMAMQLCCQHQSTHLPRMRPFNGHHRSTTPICTHPRQHAWQQLASLHVWWRLGRQSGR
jgi:hypothetical protein